MSYTVYDKSKEQGAPIDLYEFKVGAKTYRYTNAEEDLSAPSTGADGAASMSNYVAVPIERQPVKTNGKFEKSQMQIKTPVTTDLSNTFLPYPPPYVVKVVLRQRHRTDPAGDAKVVWHGRVVSSGREGKEAVLTVDNTLLSFKRAGLRRNFQHGCPLLFGGKLCRADLEPYKKVISVRKIEDGKIVLDEQWFLPWTHEKFRGGTAEWTSDVGREARTIIATTENNFTVGGVLRGVEIGTQLTLTLGCRHDMADCRFYENINNYGGQPWIPFKNPVRQHPYW